MKTNKYKVTTPSKIKLISYSKKRGQTKMKMFSDLI